MVLLAHSFVHISWHFQRKISSKCVTLLWAQYSILLLNHENTRDNLSVSMVLIAFWMSCLRSFAIFVFVTLILIIIPKINNRTDWDPDCTRSEFLREILYKNIAIIAIQHGKFILLRPQAIFPILLGKIHSSPSGKFPYTYQLKLPVWKVVITIQYGKNRHTVYSFFFWYQCCNICYIHMAIFTTLRGEIHNSI